MYLISLMTLGFFHERKFIPRRVQVKVEHSTQAANFSTFAHVTHHILLGHVFLLSMDRPPNYSQYFTPVPTKLGLKWNLFPTLSVV